MGRGRPKHPDILTPREWEVLALLREGLTNAEIAERLGITLPGARYHVSEILSKLGVSTREEAAAWQPDAAPEPRRWGLALWMKLVLGVAAVCLIAALGVLAWGVSQSSDGTSAQAIQPPAVGTPYYTPLPPLDLPWGRVSFVGSREDGTSTLYVLNLDDANREPEEFTTHEMSEACDSCLDGDVLGAWWAPDRTRVAVLVTQDAGNRIGLVVIDSDGTDPQNLAEFTTEYGYEAPCEGGEPVVWSQDATQLLYQAPGGLHLLSLNSGNDDLLVPSGFGGSWSPDGTWIAYSDFYAAPGNDSVLGDCEIVLAPLAALKQKVVLSSGYAPKWSPDGSRIAFLRRDSLLVMNWDGGRPTLLADGGVARRGALWDASGTRLMAEVNGWIVAFAAGDGSGTQLTFGQDPVWASDSWWIAFSGSGGIYTLRLDQPQAITRLAEGSGPAWQGPLIKPAPDTAEEAIDMVLEQLRMEGSIGADETPDMSVDELRFEEAAERAREFYVQFAIKPDDYSCPIGAFCPFPGVDRDAVGWLIVVTGLDHGPGDPDTHGYISWVGLDSATMGQYLPSPDDPRR